MKLLSSVAASLLLAQSCLAAKRCYYPSGKEAPGDHPCDPDAEDSPCCAGQGLNHQCLSNGLCVGTNQIARGSCTDQSWRSGECAQVCLSEYITTLVGGSQQLITRFFPSGASSSNGGSDLASCRNVTGPDTDSYCCLPNSNGQCCDRGVGRFNILAELPHTWATFDSSAGKFAIVTPLSNSNPSPSATRTSSFPTSPSTSGTTGVSSFPSQTSSSAVGPSKSQGSEEQSSSGEKEGSSSSGLSDGAKAGIGVGAAIGALLVGAVVYLLWKLKKSKEVHAAEPGPAAYGTPAWAHPSPGGSQWGAATAYSGGGTAPTHMYAGHPPVPSYYNYDQHQVKVVRPGVHGGELSAERTPQELPTQHHY
ncbi:hypothetical protein QBC43DRAFT_250034 [Cladorrhinum sp. PSN259]|nr:hypothetical protein QBC43DRAFT_250034 [Cladorrhinum sp. PSN259]